MSAVASVFNEESFLNKLDRVTPTQDSIQSLALWIIHHKMNHDTICRLWLRKLNESSINGKQRLALFYLANDVIQNCKRKNARIFQETFKKLLNEAVKLVRNDSLKKNIERVIDVWSERNVYEKDFVAKLKETLYTEPPPDLSKPKSPTAQAERSLQDEHLQPSPPVAHETKSDVEYQKIIEEFQPKKLCESINAFSLLQKETSLSKTSVEATRLLDINVEHIKQYRDKTQCANFKVEFENSCLKLEDFLKKLSREAEQRKQLIQLLEQSEIFYDAQFKDATTVVNAYRAYGSKVHAVKRKLDEVLVVPSSDAKLDAMDMEMSDEDNNDFVEHREASYGSDKHSKRGNYRHNSPGNRNNHQSSSARSNADPRQNRHNSYQNNRDRRSSHNGAKYKTPRNLSADQDKDHRSIERADKTNINSNVDASIESLSQQQVGSGGGNNPLDFLTQFINKSNTTTGGKESSVTEGSGDNKSSANLSYLVNSLKKFVNNSGEASGSISQTNAPPPLMSNSFQSSFISGDSNQANSPGSQQRSGTPTKDEVYTPQASTAQPPIPSTSPQFVHQGATAAPIPPSYHPMYAMQPPPPLPHMNLMSMPPMAANTQPQQQQLLLDTTGYHQSYMYNQPPPQLSPLAANTSQTSYQYPGGQSGKPHDPNSSYWMHDSGNPNEYVPSDQSGDLGNQRNESSQQGNNDSISGSGFQKRKYNSFDDTRRANGRGGGFYKNSNYQGNKSFGGYNNKQQSFNRIPTINSQRADGAQFNHNSSNGFSEQSSGGYRGGRGGGRHNNRY